MQLRSNAKPALPPTMKETRATMLHPARSATAKMIVSLKAITRKITIRRRASEATVSPAAKPEVSTAPNVKRLPPTTLKDRHYSTLGETPRLSLLGLPAELWSQICDHVISGTMRPQVYLLETQNARTLRDLTRLPALVYTCRALRGECLRLLGGDTLFLLIEANERSHHWRTWLEALAPDARRAVQQNLFITSAHQDLVPHLKRSGLMPAEAEFEFGEPEDEGASPLENFTYRITFPDAAGEAERISGM